MKRDNPNRTPKNKPSAPYPPSSSQIQRDDSTSSESRQLKGSETKTGGELKREERKEDEPSSLLSSIGTSSFFTRVAGFLKMKEASSPDDDDDEEVLLRCLLLLILSDEVGSGCDCEKRTAKGRVVSRMKIKVKRDGWEEYGLYEQAPNPPSPSHQSQKRLQRQSLR